LRRTSKGRSADVLAGLRRSITNSFRIVGCGRFKPAGTPALRPTAAHGGCDCSLSLGHVYSIRFWKGGGSLPRIRPGRRKVRTPKGAMPRNRDFDRGYTREATPRGVPTDSATENKPPGRILTDPVVARVKRWGKSPPPAAQATGHGKPHRVQGQIGDLRSGPLPGRSRSNPASVQVPGTGCSDK